jgi:hypothetical protein
MREVSPAVSRLPTQLLQRTEIIGVHPDCGNLSVDDPQDIMVRICTSAPVGWMVPNEVW